MDGLRYVPEFQVTLNDESVPAALRKSISAVSYQTGLEGSDRVELTLVNDNLRWLDNPLFALGNKLTLSIGYAPEPLTRVFVGEIVVQTPTFPADGMPTLTIIAQDRMQRLQEGSKTRWFAKPVPGLGFYPSQDPIVASGISLENGLFPTIDLVSGFLGIVAGVADVGVALWDPAEGQKLVRKQVGESDFDLLMRIARENGFEMLIDHSGDLGGSKLRFMSLLNRTTPELSLRYGRSLIEFNPRIKDVGQIAAVSVRVWVPQIKTEFTVTVAWDWDRSSLDVSIVPGFGLPGSVAENPEVLRHAIKKAKTPAAKKQAEMALGEAEKELAETKKKEVTYTLAGEAVTLASFRRVLPAKLIPKLNERLTGSGRSVGDPRIKAGTLLEVDGLGKQFGGIYRVTLATHTIDSGGYQTSFDVRKDFWFGSIPVQEQKQAQIGINNFLSIGTKDFGL